MKLFPVLIMLFFSLALTIGFAEHEKSPGNAAFKTNSTTSKVEADEITTLQSKKAPEFKLVSTEGKEVKLSDYKGKIVVLDFWATWCGPCRMGIPDLVALQKEYKDHLVVLGISLDKVSGTDKEVKAFMKEYKINYPVIFGNEKVTMDYGNIQAIPTSFIIDRKGNIVDKHIGLAPKEAYVKQIKALL